MYCKKEFDSKQEQRYHLYNWILQHKSYIKNSINNFEFLKIDSLQYPNTIIIDSTLIQDLDYIKDNLIEYNQYISKLKEIKMKYEKNEIEYIVSFLYPLLFSISLSLQITKDFFLSKDY